MAASSRSSGRGDGHHDHDGDHDARDEGRGDESENVGDRDHRDGRGRDDDRDQARLFIVIGDNGRRGQTQNLIDGPFVYPFPMTTDDDVVGDDQFGGPDPDSEHLTGVILRLNTDGSAPKDNPFYDEGVERGGQVGRHHQKIYAYGVRNSFGMDVDPVSGDLWTQENSDDAFDEINRVEPGMNGGWIQIMGPVDRVAEFIDRDDSAGAAREPSAGSMAAPEHRRHAGGSALASGDAPGGSLP
jgi:hypothetical protein